LHNSNDKDLRSKSLPIEMPSTEDIVLFGFLALLVVGGIVVGILYATNVIGGNNGGDNGGGGNNGGDNGGGGNNGGDNGGGGNNGGDNGGGGNNGGNNNNSGGGGNPQVIVINPGQEEDYLKITPNGAQIVSDKQDATQFIQESTNNSVNGNSVFRLRNAQNRQQYLFTSFLKTAQGKKVYTLDFSDKKQDASWYILQQSTIASTTGSGLLPYRASQASFAFGITLERNKVFYIETQLLPTRLPDGLLLVDA
jgi:hypothetical protein